MAAPSTPDRARLCALLHERSFRRKKVVLASGQESDFFIDCKQSVLTAEGHVLVGRLMLDALDGLVKRHGLSIDAIAGVELGGCSLASAVSMTSYFRERPVAALYIRKEVKDHGSRRMVEGHPCIGDAAGLEVIVDPPSPLSASGVDRNAPTAAIILEDVVTTGGSTLRAVKTLAGAGIQCGGVVALVDRLEGGSDNIRQAGLPFVSIFDRSDFMP